jgi:UDP-galactopyranose mutase
MKTAKVIGCGISGITAAVLLKEKGYKVKIFESRSHIGGNCYDSNFFGTLVHNYGPHIFHTDDEEVFNFLSKYTEWFEFRHHITGNTKLGYISLPYSKKTIKQIGRELTQDEIIDVIFKDYSEKHWGVPFEQIPKTITNRVPKTKDDEDPTWYKDEKYQCMPKEGYTKMFEKMLNGIEIILNSKNNDWKDYETDITVYTGKIDEYFDYKFGELPYRTLKFVHTTSTEKLMCAVINQNNKLPHTRSYDHSYFNYNHHGHTIHTDEFSEECKKVDIPYYPITFGEGIKTYSKYKELADEEKDVIFVGRLATYTYLDMWMAVKQAILKIKNLNLQ